MARNGLRRPTYPLSHSARSKPRRWPLVLRITKGAVHLDILIPLLLHAAFTAVIVYLDRHKNGRLGLPGSFVPSLSIVVGLMLVFRNQTSYDRYWTGRNCLTTVVSSVRNLTRSIVTSSRRADVRATDAERADTEKVVRVLVAVLYAVKNSLRSEWTTPSLSEPPETRADSIVSVEALSSSLATLKPEYSGLLPSDLDGFEDQGFALPLQLAVLIEAYIARGFERGWFHGPQASQLTVQLNSLVDAFGRMETIKTTPIPVAHLIHAKQVLALYTCVLPFAMVDDLGWWAVPIVSLVAFTLYGIEGVGSQLEDPFGYDRNDIKMDAVVEDSRTEIMVLLDEWRRGEDMFG